jgi:transposase
MTREFSLWVGIDWGNQAHQVCVLDHERRVVAQRSIKHSGEGIARLADELVELANGQPGQVAASIETTWGAVVETLLERGIAVFSINPKQLDRFRDRHTVAGAKDDRRDAFVLANALKTDQLLFHPVRLDPPDIIELRELVRVYEDLKAEIVAHGNRLGEQLHRYYPQLLELGSVHSEPWLWELLMAAPRPDIVSPPTPTVIAGILKRHRIRKVTADHVHSALGVTPLHVAPGVVPASQRHVGMLLQRLQLAHRQRIDCEKQLKDMLVRLAQPIVDGHQQASPSDAAILLSMPGVGTVVGATILADAAQLLAGRDLTKLRTRCGTAPVTKQSGKSHFVIRRMARSPRLQDAVYHWSRVSVQLDPRFRDHYTRLRAAGHRHGRALRGVADRQLAILVAMLENRTLYDPSRWSRQHDGA